jgi:hypothetical protein
VLVREPHQFGFERAHQALAIGARLVEVAEEDRRVAGDDDRRAPMGHAPLPGSGPIERFASRGQIMTAAVVPFPS